MSPDPTKTKAYEWDWLEIFHYGKQDPYATSMALEWLNGKTIDNGGNNIGDLKRPLDDQYHTLGVLVTMDVNGNAALCPYWDGVAGAGFTKDATKCETYSGVTDFVDSLSAIYLWGPNTALPNQTDIYIKSVRMWACEKTKESKYYHPANGLPVVGPCLSPKPITTPP